MTKKLVFSVLISWALFDGIWTAKDMPTFWTGIYGFFSSFVLSMLFVGAVYAVWDWAEIRKRRSLHP